MFVKVPFDTSFYYENMEKIVSLNMNVQINEIKNGRQFKVLIESKNKKADLTDIYISENGIFLEEFKDKKQIEFIQSLIKENDSKGIYKNE